MNLFIPAQTLEHVAMQSRRIAETDPHGIMISIISILVVFISLLILYLSYVLIGLCVNRVKRRGENDSERRVSEKEEEKIIDKHLHDNESYRITIRRKDKTILPGDTGIYGITSMNRQSGIEEDINGGNENRGFENGVIRSPLPGVITAIKVKVGDKVTSGQEVVVLEAMKMENAIEVEFDGTVTEIHVTKGDSVLEGAAILKIQ